jgi:hypothetical protein
VLDDLRDRRGRDEAAHLGHGEHGDHPSIWTEIRQVATERRKTQSG